ncbi:MAG TPA: methyltransferase domain-containing protein [Acidimicrobiia bacterium]|nr:methyltransferase domain-containing protein [Acidimicrobiia bacterium]
MQPRVYVSVCNAWVPREVAEPMVFLILEAADGGATARVAAEEIDARLRADFGSDWTGDRAVIQRGIRRVRLKKRADQAVRRLGPVLTRPVPDSLRPSVDRIYRPLARHLAAANSRRRYGPGFVSEIHSEDDLLHYGLDVAGSEPTARYYRAVQAYFAGGEWNAAEVDEVLAEVGSPLREAGSLLEFACGYGRLTRHFVHRISPSKLTVSDIDRRAVDFVTEKFGVRGFYSAPMADELTAEGRYDVIVVISLFSHLPIQQWGPWLERMNEMLNPGGLLLFSTLGMHAWDVNVPDAARKGFRVEAEGFLFREQNETRGRLSADTYGTSYVSERFVERVISEGVEGRLVKSCPRGLNGFQDVYVLQAAEEPSG